MPNLNIFELVWEYVDRKRHTLQPSNAKKLFEVLQDDWSRIPDTFIKKLFDSILKRINSELKARGGPMVNIQKINISSDNFFLVRSN